jgi:type IV pilus assembly protein PilV
MALKLFSSKKEEGFTLIEVMVALSILMVGLLGLASMQVASIKGNFFANRVTEGSVLASDRLEKLFSLPYTHADLASGSHTDPSPPAGRSISWTVTENSPLENTKKIDVTVSWTERGVHRSLTMERVISKML